MDVQYLTADPVASDVSQGFERAGGHLSVLEASTDLAASAAPADGLLYDYTTHGTDGVPDLRRFRTESHRVPVVAVVDTIASVGDVSAALDPVVDGWIEKATVHGEPRRALSALRYAAARPDAADHDGNAAGEGRPATAGEPTAFEDPRYELRRALGEKDRRLAELADGLSHDLRNPLMVAEEYADLALETGNEEYLGRALDAIGRASTLVEGLSALAETGQGLTVLVDVPIAPVARDAWDTLESGSATVSIEADRAVRGDPRLLGRLFEAVFDNAVEHGGPDAAVRVGATGSGFYVEDDGPGIEAGRCEALRSGSNATDGPAGVGFAVVRDVAAAHGWGLSLMEAPGGGLRIEFAVRSPHMAPVEGASESGED